MTAGSSNGMRRVGGGGCPADQREMTVRRHLWAGRSGKWKELHRKKGFRGRTGFHGISIFWQGWS